MANGRNKQVGFNRHIKLEWMEYTAQLAKSGKSRHEINDALQEYLHDKLSGGGAAKRGSREKAITILLRIWYGGNDDLNEFRTQAFKLMESVSGRNKIALNWGMSMAVYPFFSVVAGTVGRLLRLQDNVSPRQVLRRMYEQYGDRESVKRATQRFMQTLADWEALHLTDKPSVYATAPKIELANQDLAAWLSEAVILGSGRNSMALSSIVQSTALFPFSTDNISQATLDRSPRLQLVTHGLDQVIVKRVL